MRFNYLLLVRFIVPSLILLLSGCDSRTQEKRGQIAGLVADQAWYRIPLPGKDKTSAYVELHNHSNQQLVLVSAESERVRAIEIHEVSEEAGMFRMRRIKELRIEANQAQLLQPGGLHLMLFGIDPDLKAGETLTLKLNYLSSDNEELAHNQEVHFMAVDPKES